MYASGTLREQFTKSTVQFILSPSICFKILHFPTSGQLHPEEAAARAGAAEGRAGGRARLRHRGPRRDGLGQARDLIPNYWS